MRSTCAWAALDDVVLAEAEHLGGVATGVHASLEAPRDRGQDVLLAPAEHLEVVAAVLQVLIGDVVATAGAGHHVAQPLEDRPGVGALEDGLHGGRRHEPDQPDLVEVLEGVLVVGEQTLGHQLHQDRVVALERREDVGVGTQRVEPVHRQVAGAAARLAALLDGAGRVPGAHRLRAGGARLQCPASELGGTLVGDVGEHPVQIGRDALLCEVQRVGAGEQREEPPLVHAVVEEHLLLTGAGVAELPDGGGRTRSRSPARPWRR